MPNRPIHQTTHQTTKRFTEEPTDRPEEPEEVDDTGGVGHPGITIGELIRPARPAMIVSGLLTAVGALMSIVR